MSKLVDNVTLENIVYSLQGSCLSIDEVLYSYDLEYEDLDLEDFHYIDDRIFNCVRCGWWFEINEMSENCEDEGYCENCEEEEE